MPLLIKILVALFITAGVVTLGVRAAHKDPSTLPYVLAPVATTSAARTDVSSANLSSAQLALRTNAEWKNILSPAQYSILREQGTEIPFTSDLLHETRAGTFVTADCGEPVFRSEKKFDSGTGWPSFYAPIAGAVVIKTDTSFGVTREEVETPICHSHLGHLFHDAPQTPTGDRYCINGVALRFIPDPAQ
jgi:peptide-methionine (R)-S-oxide reductase